MIVMRRVLKHIGIMLLLLVTGCVFTTPVTPPASELTRITIPEQPVLYIQNQQLWLTGSGNVMPTQITDIPGNISAPAWIDETRIMYTVAVDEQYETWIVDLTTRQTTHLTDWRYSPQHITLAPNGAAMTALVNNDLYVVALKDGQRVRVHEGVIQEAWSPSSQQIVFTTEDGRLLLQDIGLDFVIKDPVLVLERMVTSPIFLDAHTLVYEGQWEDHYTLVSLDLVTQIITPVTSLRFSTSEPKLTSVRSQKDGSQILYTRPDDTTQEMNIWVVNRLKDAPKLILTKANQPLWSTDSSTIYYSINSELWRATANGFDKTKITSPVTAVATPVGAITL